MRFSIVCASSHKEVLAANLLASPFIARHDLHIQTGYTNVCKAYNDALPDLQEEIAIYVHQDVYLPEAFFPQLAQALRVETQNFASLPWDIDWGVLGVAGRKGPAYVGNLLDRGAMWGSISPDGLPIEADTLDELLLITRRGAYRFDEAIPFHHLHGADLCLQAARAGKRNYAVEAFCHHNSTQAWTLPEDFWASAEYLRNKWPDRLPIYTTCAEIL